MNIWMPQSTWQSANFLPNKSFMIDQKYTKCTFVFFIHLENFKCFTFLTVQTKCVFRYQKLKGFEIFQYFFRYKAISTRKIFKQQVFTLFSYKSCRKYALVLVESSLLVENRNLMYCKLQQLQAVLQSFLSWQQSGYKALIRIFVKVFENWFLMNCFPIHVIE